MPMMQPSMFEMLLNRRVQAPVRVAAHGHWRDPQTYVMTWQYLETPHSNTVTCKFTENDLRLEVTSSLADPNNPSLAGNGSSFEGSME